MSDERGDAVVLTREHVREDGKLKGSMREALCRKLVDAPELGRAFGIDPPESCEVWVWEVSAIERLAIDRHAGGAPKQKGHDSLKWLEAYVAFAIREGDSVESKRLFEVPGPDNGKLVELGHVFLNRIALESQMMSLGEEMAERVLADLQDFEMAEETS